MPGPSLPPTLVASVSISDNGGCTIEYSAISWLTVAALLSIIDNGCRVKDKY
jgi:hypothetical protein